MIIRDKWRFEDDVPAILCLDSWIETLAAPKDYDGLERPADPAVLLALLDIWIARGERVARGDDVESISVAWFGRSLHVEPARKLRAVIAAWTAPEVLSDEIKEAARAVLRSLGREKAPDGIAWEDYVTPSLPGDKLDDYLVWSEDFGQILPKEPGSQGEAARDEGAAPRPAPKPDTIATDRWGISVDNDAINYLDRWLRVLAVPKDYRQLQRPADPAVLLKLLDVWLVRCDLEAPDMPRKKPPMYRFVAAPARALRAAVAAWTTPEVLSDEVKEAARAVLRSLGMDKPRKGVTWEDYVSVLRPGDTLDDHLLWAEGLDWVLPKATPGSPG